MVAIKELERERCRPNPDRLVVAKVVVLNARQDSIATAATRYYKVMTRNDRMLVFIGSRNDRPTRPTGRRVRRATSLVISPSASSHWSRLADQRLSTSSVA